MKIISKVQFYSLWEAGVLGNRTRLWHDPREAFRWGLSGFRKRKEPIEIGFREVRSSASAGKGKWTKVPWNEVLKTAEEWSKEGRRFIMDDGAPDDKRTIQGELCRTFRGLEGYIDMGSKLPMRVAMSQGFMRHCTGSEIRVLLNTYMDPSSHDDIDMLFELYPDATIEFSCFSVDVGVFPGRNTLIWEVRNY